MTPRKLSLIIQSPSVSSSYVQATRPERRSTYTHTSFFRSLLLDMQIYSPSVTLVKQSGLGSPQPRPVFCDQDKIEGKVMLDPSCSQNGRLTVSLEGAFECLSVKENPDDEYHRHPTVRKHRQVFLSSSASIPFSPIPDSRSSIREALSVRKRPSTSSLNSLTSRSCDFSFELPRGSRTGEEMPPTFMYKNRSEDSQKQLGEEGLEVAYRITVVWESSDGSENQAILEAPIVFQPDTDFQSFDGSAINPGSWLELPLIPERPIPFSCAVTLPRPHSFSRGGSIPYFVVFAATTRSQNLVKEIAADATIAMSLVRKITIAPQRTPPSPILSDTPPASDESDGQTSPFTSRPKLLKRNTRSPAQTHTRDESFAFGKPLPDPSQEIFSVSRTLQTQVNVGFPKRPRVVEASQNLPDGLHKGKMQLSKNLIPSADWSGLSVKYYLDVSVLAGQDDVRARIPIKIY